MMKYTVTLRDTTGNLKFIGRRIGHLIQEKIKCSSNKTFEDKWGRSQESFDRMDMLSGMSFPKGIHMIDLLLSIFFPSDVLAKIHSSPWYISKFDRVRKIETETQRETDMGDVVVAAASIQTYFLASLLLYNINKECFKI